MNEQEKLKKISAMSDRELEMRRKLINFAIRTCLLEGDPQDQVSNYKAQLQRITAEIRKRKKVQFSENGDKPNTIIINANIGKMGAKSKSLGR